MLSKSYTANPRYKDDFRRTECKFCGEEIAFDRQNVHQVTGRPLPLNPDLSVHNCRGAIISDEKRVAIAIRYIAQINGRLADSQLKLSRIDKHTGGILALTSTEGSD